MGSIIVRDRNELDHRFLVSSVAPSLVEPTTADVSIVDLFSGCGGLSLGAIEAARRSGRSASIGLAVDSNPRPLEVLRASLGLSTKRVSTADLGLILGGLASAPSQAERALLAPANGATLLLAGPPCQGHSALNNYTRHDDPRNDLYLAVARVARLLSPQAVIVENVRGVGADRRGAVARCAAALEELGYGVDERPIDLSTLGAPQRRLRHVLVATRGGKFEWSLETVSPRTIEWGINDLANEAPATPFRTPTAMTDENRRRIDWLFENGEYNLPNHLRPRCHQGDDHSYISMYGRLRWDAPAQTITSGFGTMGQGRFVHPTLRRTLTPHEAARLQFLPDYLQFDGVRHRGQLAKMIGNAAPPALTLALVSALLEQDLL